MYAASDDDPELVPASRLHLPGDRAYGPVQSNRLGEDVEREELVRVVFCNDEVVWRMESTVSVRSKESAPSRLRLTIIG